MQESVWVWIGFTAFIVVLLLLDLLVFHRKAHEVSTTEAAAWTAGWIALALLFNLGVWYELGGAKALEFLTGYVIEKSLSIDNIFLFLVLFRYFRVPGMYQHRVLFWGIFGALFMRFGLILTGTHLVHRFEWLIYVFGAFLVITGVRMAFRREEGIHPERNPVVNLVRQVLPVTDDYHGQALIIRQDGRLVATPLMIVLVMIESTDLLFALDSIPAVIAVTRDPFIIFSSNAFAILGLRALYFLVARAIARLRFLEFGLAAILVFTGLKMLTEEFIEIPILVSLLTIVAILALTLIASVLLPHGMRPREESEPGTELEPRDDDVGASLS